MIIDNKDGRKGLKMSLLSFDLMYFIQVKRIAANLSQEELSFLLARGNGFIGEREAFKIPKELWMRDITTMSKIFDCSPTEFFRIEKDEYAEVKLLARQTRASGKIQYEVFRLRPDQSIELIYMINEVDPLKKYNEGQKAHFLQLSKKEISRLLAVGYFEQIPRVPFEIFQECRRRGGLQIKAQFIAQVLDELAFDKKKPVLKKYRHNDYGFVYEGL